MAYIMKHYKLKEALYSRRCFCYRTGYADAIWSPALCLTSQVWIRILWPSMLKEHIALGFVKAHIEYKASSNSGLVLMKKEHMDFTCPCHVNLTAIISGWNKNKLIFFYVDLVTQHFFLRVGYKRYFESVSNHFMFSVKETATISNTYVEIPVFRLVAKIIPVTRDYMFPLVVLLIQTS